jgi:hypothetical protein
VGTDGFGEAVAGLGDLDADGVSELLVGAPFSAPSGKVFVYSAGKSMVLFSLPGQATDFQFGEVVANAGDVDGDGMCDLLIGAPDASVNGMSEAGRVWVYSGRSGDALFNMGGSQVGDRLGEGVDGVGDVDGDGRDEVIVGAPGADPNGMSNAGRVLVLGL